MSFYLKTPYKPVPTLLIQGTPEFVYGSLNDKVGPTFGYIISDSAVTTTATVTFRIVSGNIPTPNSLVTVVGAANSANLNVTNGTIITATTTDAGISTITYAVTSSTIAAGTADAGQVYIAVPEVPDNLTASIVSNLATNAGASVPVAAPVGSTSIGRSISVTVNLLANSTTYASNLTGVTVVIQGANKDRDDYFNTIGTITASGAAGNVYGWQSGQGTDKSTGTGVLADGDVNLPQFLFYRLNVTGATGAGYLTGSIIA
jgi:hypothetical protein